MTPPPFWRAIFVDLLGALFYVTNWLITYYGRGGSPFSHTWSLSIEEQFYTIWPLTLLLLLRFVRRSSWIAAILLTAAAVSLALRLGLALVPGARLTPLFVGSHTHADGLLIGAALAVLLSRPGGLQTMGALRRPVVAASIVVLPLVLVAAPAVHGYVLGVTALAALATAGLILDIVGRTSRATHWLKSKWLVRIGQISYGLYLWHFPVFQNLGVLRQPGDAMAPFWRSALAWGLSFAAALISYVLIERPVLAYKRRLTRDSAIEAAADPVAPPATEKGERALTGRPDIGARLRTAWRAATQSSRAAARHDSRRTWL